MKTLGEFIDLIYAQIEKDENLFSMKEYLDVLMGKGDILLFGEVPEDFVEKYRSNPFNKWCVIDLANRLASMVKVKLDIIDIEEFFSSVNADGHKALRAIHKLAVEQGLTLDVRQVDVPITIADMFISSGAATLEDGVLVLTAEGKKDVEDIERQIRLTDKKSTTGRIKIVKVPAGEAPIEVRKAWVGLILPCDPYLGYPDNASERGVLTNKKRDRNRCGFSVPQDQAIEILEKEHSEAAAWWKAHGFPQDAGSRFGFAEEEGEIISGVTRQQIIEVTDEMQGDPNR